MVPAMMQTSPIESLAQRLASLVPPGLREAREEMTENFRDTLRAGLRELDLVTREEFDVQRCVLLRTREKIEELERRIAALEQHLAGDATRDT
jgi:BMFP domain-containing protein YqiC